MRIANLLKCVIALLSIGLHGNSYAGWGDPVVLVSGTWGSSEKQFGFEPTDMGAMFAGPFDVSNDGFMAIGDNLNGKIKFFNPDGSLGKVVVAPVKDPSLWILEPIFVGSNFFLILDKIYIYTKSGEFLSSVEVHGGIRSDSVARMENRLFFQSDDLWKSYSPTGELLQTYSERPLELGLISGKNLGNGKYNMTVKFPDMTYSIPDGPYEKYLRDTSDNINAASGKGVDKYDMCGKKLGSIVIPRDEYKIIRPGGNGIEEQREVIAEYGQALVGPNGDVYTWKRTPDTYSILKWPWVDSPDDPKPCKKETSKK